MRKFNHRRYCIFTLLLLLPFMSALAIDVKDFTFSHIGIEQGMDNQRVYSICQTNDGAVWWATKRGVGRTNGHSIKNYSLGDKVSYSNGAGRVIKIVTPQSTKGESTNVDNGLYVYDNNGNIFRFNAILDRFVKITSITELLKRELVLNDVYVEDGCIWLAMNDGVYRFADDKINCIRKNVYANCIVKTRNSLLFCTKQGVYNEKGLVLKGIDAVCGFFDKKNNRIWFGTFNDGVKVVDSSCKGAVSNIEGIPHNPVRSIQPYNGKTMLIGVDGFGVYEAPLTSHLKHLSSHLLFNANEGENGVLHGNGIYSLLVDTWNNIIIGSYSGGIDIARPSGGTTAIFKHIKNNKESLLNDHTNCVLQTSPNMLMMGTDDGVSQFCSSTNQWKHVGQGLVVLDMCMHQGKLLVATYGKGVCEIDAAGNAHELYTVKNGSLKDDHVYKLLYDKHGNLWMACLDGELAEKTDEGITYYNIRIASALAELPDGSIAVGSANGLHFVNPKTRKITDVKYMMPGTDDVNRFVIDLFLQNDHTIWIATDGGGAYIYDLKTKACRQISTQNGLPSNTVTSITTDKAGRIWLATDNGLVFVSGGNVVDVNYCYGLKREYTRDAVCNLANGNIMYGSVDGAVIINPRNIKQLDYKAHLNILGVTCSVDDSDDFKEDVHEMLAKGRLDLDYDQRTFELFFEAINMRNQFDIAYQYKVGDEDWSQMSDMEYIRFENLETGKHKLILRAVSKTSGMVLDEQTIVVDIAHPWWSSWWMRFVYFVLLAFAFYGAWKVYELHTKYMRLVVQNVNTADAVSGEEKAETSEPVQEEDIAANDDTGKDFVDKATKLVLTNIMDPNFTIDDLCSEMAMSRTLFYVKLKSFTGKSPQDFVRIIRLEKATSLLRSGKSVTDVAVMVGFDNPKYFSTVFKKYFGVSPSKYQ